MVTVDFGDESIDVEVTLFTGRISLSKNVMQLLNALPRIRAEIPDAHLVVVGTGPESAKLEKRARRFGDSVTIWGPSSGDELKGWYARATVFLNPSVTENFCTTILEALASGAPCVVANANGNPEQVADGKTGFLARPDDPGDLADKTIALLKNPELLVKISLAIILFCGSVVFFSNGLAILEG